MPGGAGGREVLIPLPAFGPTSLKWLCSESGGSEAHGQGSASGAGCSALKSSHASLLRYKKNLKALYVVHPTNFIKVLWTIFKPLIRYVVL